MTTTEFVLLCGAAGLTGLWFVLNVSALAAYRREQESRRYDSHPVGVHPRGEPVALDVGVIYPLKVYGFRGDFIVDRVDVNVENDSLDIFQHEAGPPRSVVKRCGHRVDVSFRSAGSPIVVTPR